MLSIKQESVELVQWYQLFSSAPSMRVNILAHFIVGWILTLNQNSVDFTYIAY